VRSNINPIIEVALEKGSKSLFKYTFIKDAAVPVIWKIPKVQLFKESI